VKGLEHCDAFNEGIRANAGMLDDAALRAGVVKATTSTGSLPNSTTDHANA
jgi:hypothetical protein